MNQVAPEQKCNCECGRTEFVLQGKPLMRMFCHCTICQEFNEVEFSDATIFLAKDIEFDRAQNVVFRKYKAPPAVDRGKCGSCQKPIIEFLDVPLFPSLAMIPSQSIDSGSFLPESCAHIFYHRRVNDINDDLPKYSGFISSQVLFMKKLFVGMLSRKRNA